MHPPTLRVQALALADQGVNDCEISRRLGVPRTTVRDWRHGYPRGPALVCPRCWRASRPIIATDEDYAELLGVYLGDGHITAMPRTHRLRVSLDAKYPNIVTGVEQLLARCLPTSNIARVTADGGSTVVVQTWHCHLPCLLPQHGPGKKHHRRIALEPWQIRHVEAAPWSFIRGCIRTDGCAFINRTGPYEYLSYEFDNHSEEILGLFTRACVDVGLHPRQYAERVRLCRRRDVALLVEHVGLKS